MTYSTTVPERLPSIQDDLAFVVNGYDEMRAMEKTCLERAIQCGERLKRMKARVGHGKWLPFLHVNAPNISERTVSRWINLYENRDQIKSANVSDLSAAYRLLSTPQESAPEAIEQVDFSAAGYKAIGEVIRVNWELPLDELIETIRAYHRDNGWTFTSEDEFSWLGVICRMTQWEDE